jgi:3-methyl-2-oxobutanoate hydroxymethyltransferase
MTAGESRKKNTVITFFEKKVSQEKIAVLTAYDYFIAHLLDSAGIDAVLVGDSAANVIHGFKSTLPISMDIMVAHTAAVSRGTKYALVIADMPFLSFQPSIEVAVINAGRFLKEGNAEAVKIEGGMEMVAIIKRVIECGIPVMGHIGMTPQSINRFGGPKVQGREQRSKSYLVESAQALEEAGCFGCVLELVQSDISEHISKMCKVMPTIGIGAGIGCDGQVLVTNDILGLTEEGFTPKFLREYANLSPIIFEAVKKFIADVKSQKYPGERESY